MKCNRVVKPIKFHEGRSFFMPDVDAANEARNFHIDIPARTTGNFFLKGSGSLDWGMQHRLARVFSPATGRTVMLAIDHGYFQGPTTGLERVDVNILPLLPYAGALMCTRGILRSTVPSASTTPVVRHARYLRLACRICAELGAQFVKTYYVGEGFETVTASCPVPIVMAGGKKL